MHLTPNKTHFQKRYETLEFLEEQQQKSLILTLENRKSIKYLTKNSNNYLKEVQ